MATLIEITADGPPTRNDDEDGVGASAPRPLEPRADGLVERLRFVREDILANLRASRERWLRGKRREHNAVRGQALGPPANSWCSRSR